MVPLPAVRPARAPQTPPVSVLGSSMDAKHLPPGALHLCFTSVALRCECVSDSIAWPGARSVRNAAMRVSKLPACQQVSDVSVHRPRNLALNLQFECWALGIRCTLRDCANLPVTLSHRTPRTCCLIATPSRAAVSKLVAWTHALPACEPAHRTHSRTGTTKVLFLSISEKR